MTQPDQIEALTRALRADIDHVHARILAELTTAAASLPGTPPAQRAHRLRTLEQTLRALADEADSIAARTVLGMVQTAYELGAWGTATVATTPAVFSGVDVNAVTHLAQDTMDNLLQATQGVREDVKVVIRELTRDQVRAKLYTGQTARQAGRELAERLTERGITAVTYSNGARMPLPAYAEMVARTKTAEAYQEGGLNQGERLGIDWWEIMDGPGCGLTGHGVGPDADGMIVDLATARAHPLAHPNCRRASSPRPDLNGLRDVDDAAPTPRGVLAERFATASAAQATAALPPAAAARAARRSAALDLTVGIAVSPAAVRNAVRVARRA